MKSKYNPKKIPGDIENVLEAKVDGLFHIGQSYDKDPCDTYYCKNCGGNVFNVGNGSFFTAVRCVKCEYEVCVHDG